MVVRLATILTALFIAGPAIATPYVFSRINDPFDTSSSTAIVGINDAGVLAGEYYDNTETSHGFIEAGGVFTQLDDPSAGHGSGWGTHVSGINNAGTVVGNYTIDNSSGNNFIWSGGSFTSINDPSAVPGSISVTGINNLGAIVGSYTGTDGRGHGFVYAGGKFTTIDDPSAGSTPVTLGIGTEVFGINDAGTMVGEYSDSAGNLHGFVDVAGTFSDIVDPSAPTGCGFCASAPEAINDAGAIVGAYSDAAQNTFSFLDVGGTFTPIVDPSASLGGTVVFGINNAGTIVGQSGTTTSSGGFVGTPSQSVPEPASLPLLTIGLTVLGIARRRNITPRLASCRH